MPEDVAAIFPDVCAHRLMLNSKARMMEEKPEGILAEILQVSGYAGAEKMKIVRKIVWLLLTMGLIVLTVQTASPIALGIAACMVLLPLICLPVNLYAAKKLKLAVKLPVNLRKSESGTAELTVQNPTWLSQSASLSAVCGWKTS